MRCFIAIDIDEKVRTQIDRLQRRLRNEMGLGSGEVKWVDPAAIHLTVKFLGEVSDQNIGDVCRIVKDVACGFEGFSVNVEKLGVFGPPARVLWVGISPSDPLAALHKELDNRLMEAGLGAGDGKAFSGHLTLCRIKKQNAGRKIQQTVKNYSDLDFGTLFVDSICVYKSELTSSGPIYTLVSGNPLR